MQFNGAEAKAAPKSTVALQFSYGKKKSDLKKESSNLYELGGGRNLVNLIQIPFNEK